MRGLCFKAEKFVFSKLAIVHYHYYTPTQTIIVMMGVTVCGVLF